MESPTLEQTAKTLADAGAVYIATDRASLVQEPVRLYYHLPAGTPEDGKERINEFLTEAVGHRLCEELGALRIADELKPTLANHVLHNGLHLYRRTPVYVEEGIPGIDPVSIEDGVTEIRDIITDDIQPPQKEAITVPLEELVEELAEAGAASVEIEHGSLSSTEPMLGLRVPMIPAEGMPIIGPIESVEVNGDVYSLRSTLTLGGPYGTGGNWTALYVSDNVEGLAPMSVEEGMEAGRDLLERAKEVDMLYELQVQSDAES